MAGILKEVKSPRGRPQYLAQDASLGEHFFRWSLKSPLSMQDVAEDISPTVALQPQKIVQRIENLSAGFLTDRTTPYRTTDVQIERHLQINAHIMHGYGIPTDHDAVRHLRTLAEAEGIELSYPPARPRLNPEGIAISWRQGDEQSILSSIPKGAPILFHTIQQKGRDALYRTSRFVSAENGLLRYDPLNSHILRLARIGEHQHPNLEKETQKQGRKDISQVGAVHAGIDAMIDALDENQNLRLFTEPFKLYFSE